MKKREQGVLTVEASIVLTLCVFFMLFLFSFSRVYNAQSLVSHAILQSSDAIALESYFREETFTGSEEAVSELVNRYLGTTSVSAENYASLRSADIPKIAREKFVYAIANNEVDADKKLKSVGVKNGLAGVDFSGSFMDLGNDDVVVYANYSVEMQFGFFNCDEIDFTKAARSKTFGDILFGIDVIPEDPDMGKTAGGGSYKHGTKVQISATANYGYEFVKWSDGSTENPREVTVTGSKTYVAVFKAKGFGVTLECSPESGGTATGGGTLNYLTSTTITATPKAGYKFDKWSIYSHKDKTRKVVSDISTVIKVDQSYTCTAYFSKQSFTVNVEIQGASGNYANIVYKNKSSISITAPYQEKFNIVASTVNRYKFLGWKVKGSSTYFSNSTSVPLTVPAANTTYVACYESTLRTVSFYNRDGSLYTTRQVYAGETLGSKMPPNPYSTGYRFGGWNGFSSGTVVYSNTNVYGNWSKCTSHKWGHCGVKHYHGYNKWMSVTSIHLTEAHYSSWASCTRCVYCKKQGSYRVLCGKHWEKWGAKGWAGYDYVGSNDCGSYNLP